jgi:predicted dehydrogenase
MPDVKKVGLIGCGGIANAHAHGVADLPHVTLVACCDVTTERAQAYADRYDVPQSFTDPSAMLDATELDLLIISTWPGAYVDIVPEVVERVPAILCQKPLGKNGEDALKIRDWVAKAPNRPKFMEAFMYRHHPLTLHAIDLAKGGAIGDVYHIRGVFTQGRGSLQNWRRRPELGGGSMQDIGCYALNGAFAMTDARPVSASAVGWINPESGVEERISGLIEFEDGTSAHLESSFETPRWRQVLEVVGTAGAVEVVNPWTPDMDGSGIRVFQEPGQQSSWLTFGAVNRYAPEIAHLLECADTGAEPRVRLDRTVEAMLTIDALITSIKERATVDIAALPS